MPIASSAAASASLLKCGYLLEAGKARTSTRCVTPSLSSKSIKSSSSRVECPTVKTLTGSTLHVISPPDGACIRRRLMDSLSAEQDSSRANVVANVDEQQRQITAAPQQTGEHDEAAHLSEQSWNRVASLR